MIRGAPQRTSILALLLLASCSPATPPVAFAPLDPAGFDGERALYEATSFVALGPRDATTPGAQRAAEYLAARLRKLGLEAEVDEFQDRTPFGTGTFRNVIGRLPGSRPGLVVVGAHYDTKAGLEPGFQGANDSGSGVGALLELARALVRGGWTGPAIEVVFFDGEEAARQYGPSDGLHGSRHHAARLVREGRRDEVRAMILMDMIGDRDLTVTLPRNVTPALASRVLQAAHAEGARHAFSLYPYEIGDDHEPFLQAGMPAVNLIDFQFGSAPGRNDYWHSPEDTLDKISAVSLQTVGRVVVRVLNDVAMNP